MGDASPFAWAHIKDHWSKCGECEGSGVDDDGDACTGQCQDGELWWGSFYANDDGECDHCGEPNMPISEGLYEDTWACLRCHLVAHQRDCGCDLWRAAEVAYGLPTAPTCGVRP